VQPLRCAASPADSGSVLTEPLGALTRTTAHDRSQRRRSDPFPGPRRARAARRPRSRRRRLAAARTPGPRARARAAAADQARHADDRRGPRRASLRGSVAGRARGPPRGSRSPLLPLAAARLARRQRRVQRPLVRLRRASRAGAPRRAQHACARPLAARRAPARGAPAGGARLVAAQHAAPRAAAHRRPLRHRQRPIPSDARRDDDLLLRVLPGRRDVAARRAGRQARADLPQARAGARRPRPRDRGRLGRLRDPRRVSPRLPGHDDDDLRRAASAGRAADPRGRRGAPRDAVARRLPRARRVLRQARLDRDDRGCRLAVPGHVLQAITIDERAYHVEKAKRSFANTHVFPGGCLPSLRAISRSVSRATDLRPIALEDITDHYIRTLRCWRENFLGQLEHVRSLGYDARFQRRWELYLAYCEGGFGGGRIGDVQLLLAKPHRTVTAERD